MQKKAIIYTNEEETLSVKNYKSIKEMFDFAICIFDMEDEPRLFMSKANIMAIRIEDMEP